MLDKKMYLSLLGLLCLVATANGQMDTTGFVGEPPDSVEAVIFNDTINLGLSGSEPETGSIDDPLLAGSFKEVTATFSVPVIANVESVQIELSVAGKANQIRYRKHYTKSELISGGLISGSDVNISLGNHETGQTYKVDITLLREGGAEGRTISKTLEL